MSKKTNHAEDKISRIFNDESTVTNAIQAGINAALLKHKQLGQPICVWREGKVVWIAPENIKLEKQG